MAYATVADLYRRYSMTDINFLADNKIEVDSEGNPSQSRDDVLSVALSDASTIIDGYISGRVILPAEKVPEVLVRTACILAYYNLADRTSTDKATKDYDDTLRYLEKVAQGQISLGLTLDKKPPDEVNDTAIITSAGSVWSRERSKGFI